MSLLDICICVFVIILGFNLPNLMGQFGKRRKKLLRLLWLFHMAFTLLFYFYINQNGGDATHYWMLPKEMSWSNLMSALDRSSASGMIFLINYFPSNVLELDFLTGNFGYSIIGYLGVCLFVRLQDELASFGRFSETKVLGIPVFPYIWFLPNLHFWTSGIGKDTLIFFAIGLFIWALVKLKNRWFYLFISGLLCITIRPHILLFLVFAFGVAQVFDRNLKPHYKVGLIGLFVVAFALMFNSVLSFIQLENLELSTIENYASSKARGLNQARSGSGVDISGYPFIFKYFTLLYRPFFFDINGVFAIITSFENLILLLLSIRFVSIFKLKRFARLGTVVIGSFIFFLVGTSALSLILGNLGIMLRQKNMFIPALLVVILTVFWHNEMKPKQS